jgi:hypothetical protein
MLKRLPSDQLSGVPELRNSREVAPLADTEQVFGLRREVLAAAEREATEIVTAANNEVRRVVSRARRELLVLATQVQSVSRSEDLLLPDTLEREPRDTPLHLKCLVDSPETPRRVLDHARRDFEVLWEETEALHLRLHPEPAEPLSSYFVSETPAIPSVRQAFLPASKPGALFSPKPDSTGRLVRPFVALFTVIGTAILVATIWWRSDTPGALRGDRLPESHPLAGDIALEQEAIAPGGPMEVSLNAAAGTSGGDGQFMVHDLPVTVPPGAGTPASTERLLPADAPPAAAPLLERALPPTLPASSPAPQVDAGQPAHPEAPPAPASAEAEDLPPPAPTPSAPAGRVDIVLIGQSWLDAYYRSDSAAISSVAADNLTIFDQRAPEERLPGGLTNVVRTLDDVQLELVGDSAILSARMTERAETGGHVQQHAALVSQMWIRRTGRWQLTNVRLVNAN